MDRQEVKRLIKERENRIFLIQAGVGGSVPAVSVRGDSLAEAWENSLLALYFYGMEMETEYDARGEDGKLVFPPSRDCTMTMVVSDPAGEPFIHRGFPGGLSDLEEYRQEVLEGIKDHWVRDTRDPEDKRWEYTYHERLFAYSVPGKEGAQDQVEEAIECLARSPFTRRAQAITWKVWEDSGIADPACLQSLWFRMARDEKGILNLNINVRFRSRDAYDAAFMNCFALIHLQEKVAREVSARRGEEVRLGRYLDQSDSYHIYGRRIRDFEERFLGQLGSRSFAQRTWTREFAESFFSEAREGIARKVREQDRKKKGD